MSVFPTALTAFERPGLMNPPSSRGTSTAQPSGTCTAGQEPGPRQKAGLGLGLGRVVLVVLRVL